MEAKLKALKVADLKEILATASVSTPTRVNKADLIAKILASDPAQAVYRRKYEPDTVPSIPSKDSLLEPPEDDITWSDPEDVSIEATPSAKSFPAFSPHSTSTPMPTIANQQISKPADPSTGLDSEGRKLQARAVRFGLPNEEEKLRARAERFGMPTSGETPSVLATEEAEKELAARKARAERFGIPLVDSKQTPPELAHGRIGRRPQLRQPPGVPDASYERSKLFPRSQRSSTNKPSPNPAGKRKPVQDVDPEEAERRRKRAKRFGTGKKS
ncbi:hypothetical protein K488DRAFT_88967 [Vararia minispora EC-137]|uniref:Uncharacterized protein n=1 Tax=Vararia minispora EC-137 TaxID=1314806 RepID=A0ACB8QC65_9AGAM|nr:hypothetical protein K488DRAFT_88967 [Vararia minispora EC-137]